MELSIMMKFNIGDIPFIIRFNIESEDTIQELGIKNFE